MLASFARLNKSSITLNILLVSSCYADKNNFPILKCSTNPSTYERILMTQLRNKNSSAEQFRNAANKIIELLVFKLVDCFPTSCITIDTPIAQCQGEILDGSIEFVSIMRSGDIPLHIMSQHFPHAPINKILIQRNEETAKPVFKYMKLSPTISQAKKVVITEPMIATGGTLCMVIELLKQQGVEEKNIVIAAICAAPEGLALLSQKFPEISMVLTVVDDKLNEKKYISPGIGDFGDRYFGT